MKKLMIAAVAVAFAAVAQAATVTWASGVFKAATSADGGWGTTSLAAGTVSGVYFEINAAAYAALTADFAQSKIWEAYDASMGTLKVGESTFAKAKDGVNAATGLSLKSDTVFATGDTVYGALIYTYHDANLDKDFYIANAGTFTWTSSSNKTMTSMATKFNSTGATLDGWQAVPEPTSGLLLLLGMGALALRRKQA